MRIKDVTSLAGRNHHKIMITAKEKDGYIEKQNLTAIDLQ